LLEKNYYFEDRPLGGKNINKDFEDRPTNGKKYLIFLQKSQ